MNNEWRKSSKLIAGEKAVEHKLNMNKGISGEPAEHELCLAGYRGEIFQYNKTEWCAIITNPTAANYIATRLGSSRRYKKGCEALFRFHENLLPEVVKAIKLPKSHQTRVRLADNFGKSK